MKHTAMKGKKKQQQQPASIQRASADGALLTVTRSRVPAPGVTCFSAHHSVRHLGSQAAYLGLLSSCQAKKSEMATAGVS